MHGKERPNVQFVNLQHAFWPLFSQCLDQIWHHTPSINYRPTPHHNSITAGCTTPNYSPSLLVLSLSVIHGPYLVHFMVFIFLSNEGMRCWTGLKPHCCAQRYSCKILCVDPRNHTCVYWSLFFFRSHAVKMSQIMITQSFSLYEYRTVLKGFTHSWWVLMERLCLGV